MSRPPNIKSSPQFAALSLASAAVLIAAFVAFGVQTVSLVVIGAAVLAFVVKSPRFSFALWVASVCFLPFWLGIRFLAYWPPSSLAGIAVLGGVLLRGNFRLLKPNVWDFLVLAFAAIAVILAGLGVSMNGHMFTVVGQWLVAYFVGRILVKEVGLDFALKVVAIAFTVVAAFTVVESLTTVNLFQATIPDGAQFSSITRIQERGGQVRAEFSFGHAIALSNSLALAIPLTLASKLPNVMRVSCAALIAVATLLTISRSGILTMVLALTFAVYALSRTQIKTWVRASLAAVFVAGSVALGPWILSVFTASSSETVRTSAYRVRLFDLASFVKPFGLADGYTEESTGEFKWQGISSIDNAFLRIGVNFGMVAAVLVLAIFALAMSLVIMRRASPPVIALAAVTPALFTVALITQFGSLVFFYAGLAALIWSQSVGDRSRDDSVSEREKVPA